MRHAEIIFVFLGNSLCECTWLVIYIIAFVSADSAGPWEQNGPLRDWRRVQLKRTDLKVRHYMGEEKKAGLKPGTYRDNAESQKPHT
jgi:hypothetical protein